MGIKNIIDFDRYPLDDLGFRARCTRELDAEGVLVLPGFIGQSALADMQAEAEAARDQAFFCVSDHSVYLTPQNEAFDADHPANRTVVSSKGCVCDDVVRLDSPLRQLYNAPEFQGFVADVTGEPQLYPYADPLSSINIHYAERGQELGWHFDNSSFATTLLIQKPEAGSQFQYVKNLRDADAGEMNFPGVRMLLDGEMPVEQLEMDPGTLVLFRGRNSAHRVTPNESDRTRMLAVLAYNSEPGVSLSESARMTFYGRLG